MSGWCPRLLGAALVCAGCACLGCGLQPVELAPAAARPQGADEVLVGDVPAAALAQLRAHRAEQGDEALALIYPEPPELIVPADLAAIGFEWRAQPKPKGPGMPMSAPLMPPMDPAPAPPTAAGRAAPEPPDPLGGPKAKANVAVSAYELRAHSALSDVRIYVAAEAVTFPRERWRQLLRAHSGGSLSLALRGVRRDGTFVHAPPLRLNVRAALPAGLFYAFSTTSRGLTRAQLSDSHDTVRRPPAPLEAEPPTCIGCHAISRDGRRALAALAAAPSLLSWTWSGDSALRIAWPGAVGDAYLFGDFDPTAARIAATRAGRLLIFDADSGELMAQSAAPLMAAVSAPAWSPDGRTVAVATPDDAAQSQGTGLATVAVGLDGRLSALRPLVAAGKDETLHTPVYSPDGQWLVYERRMGPAQDERDSRLLIVRASGAEPIELRALAARAKPMQGASAPAFVPGDRPERVYLLFRSHRGVGSFMPAEGQQQLFAAELDLSLAAAGADPSHAAFWLPFQQRTNSYLRVQWGPAPASCTPSGEVCDETDDDCDGAIDEDCCAPSAERCDNGSDDDCDGAVDEGCGCAFLETCGNMSDDDCDTRIDEKPCKPAAATR